MIQYPLSSLCSCSVGILEKEKVFGTSREGSYSHLGHSARTRELGRVPEGCEDKASSILHGLEKDRNMSRLPQPADLNFSVCTGSQGSCENVGYDLVGLEWAQRFCISNKLAGDADAAGPWTTNPLNNKALHYYMLQVCVTITIMFTEHLTCPRHYLKCIMELLHLSLLIIIDMAILIPTLPMRKLRYRNVK